MGDLTTRRAHPASSGAADAFITRLMLRPFVAAAGGASPGCCHFSEVIIMLMLHMLTGAEMERQCDFEWWRSSSCSSSTLLKAKFSSLATDSKWQTEGRNGKKKKNNGVNRREQDVKQPEDRKKKERGKHKEWKRHIKGASIISRGTPGLFLSLSEAERRAAASRPVCL